MRILLDTNIVLDVLLRRQPFYDESYAIWKASDEGKFDAHVAAFALPAVYYICEKQAGKSAASSAISTCLAAFEVSALYRECVIAAHSMRGRDFEDNLQVACAITDFPQGIVTRDPTGFAESPVPVYSPAEWLNVLRSHPKG